MINMQWVLYLLTDDVYHSHGISNLHNDFKKQVLVNNCPVLFIFNLIILFLYVYKQ